MARNTKSILGFGLALGLGVALLAPPANAAMFACDDASNFCLDGETDAEWEADAKSSSKDRGGRKEGGETLSISIEGGRGSVFINGRYAGTAPLDSAPIPAGKNDIQVRDGTNVLATGLLTVPKGANLSATVRHP